MAAKKQNGKEQKAEQQAPESTQMRTPEPDGKRESTTIWIKFTTKDKLDKLMGMLNQPDYNSTLTRIIDLVPQQLSSEEFIHLKMPISKYRWLLAHQDSCDCRKTLNDAKV